MAPTTARSAQRGPQRKHTAHQTHRNIEPSAVAPWNRAELRIIPDAAGTQLRSDPTRSLRPAERPTGELDRSSDEQDVGQRLRIVFRVFEERIDIACGRVYGCAAQLREARRNPFRQYEVPDCS